MRIGAWSGFFCADIGRTYAGPSQAGQVDLSFRICEILGYSPEELVGKTLSEVTYAEDLADDLAKFDALRRGDRR